MTSSSNFTVSNLTLQNRSGSIACNAIFAPPSAEWQQLIGFSSNGLSPRSPHHTLPAVLEARQASRPANESAALAHPTPFYASSWYGPESNASDFFLALATMIVKISIKISNSDAKDAIINHQCAEAEGYRLNVTNEPLPGQQDYLTRRGVLNICAHAYGQLSRRLGYGVEPLTSFETILLWTNGTESVGQRVLRYEGAVV